MSRISLLAASAALGLATASIAAAPATAKPLESVGITLGSLGNPYFVALVKGVTQAAQADNPKVRVVSSSADYDLNKQFTQIDNFIASGVNVIILNAVDPNAILPAIKRAQKAGIVVVAADVAATGADATVETDNVAAGREACEALVKGIGGKGNVIIQNGPQVSSVIDRVKGCKEVLAKNPDVKLLSSDQDGKGSRDGGLAVMQGYLIRYPDIAGVFCINDPQAIGSSLAAKQTHRNNIIITSVDGAPDIVNALQEPNAMIKASASQDPYTMGQLALKNAVQIMDGNKPAQPVILMAPKLITKENVASYTGWTQH
jgi:ribose transport system substrate-binding protein